MILLSSRVYRSYRTCRISLDNIFKDKTPNTNIEGRRPLNNCPTFNFNKSLKGHLLQNNLEHSIDKMVKRQKSNITLYKTDLSPPARAVMMIIDVLGLEVNKEDLNPVAREQDEPEFVKMNPMKTVPILDVGDFSLGDSHAIMIYLMEKYGKAEHSQLYPTDIRKRSTIHHVLFFECGILFPRLRAIMAPTYFGRLTELSKVMITNMEDAYGMIEQFLSQRKFVADDVLTIADFSVYTTTLSLHIVHPADEKRFPKLNQWLKTMSELDVVKRINEPSGTMHGITLLKIMEMNKENQQKKSKL